MKNLILFACCILILFGACRNEVPRYIVTHIGFEKYNNRMVYLSRMSADLLMSDMENGLPPLDSAIVVDGTVTFTGPEDTLHIYVIQDPDDNYIGFIPERGELTIIPIHVDDGIGGFRYETQMPGSKNELMHDLMFNKRFAPEATRRAMFANMGNILGCSLFERYAVIYPDELERIYQHTNPRMRDSVFILQELKQQLEETKELIRGERFVDFKQITWKGTKKRMEDLFAADSIRFSEIAGNGKPVSLVFACNHNEKNKLMLRMRELQEKHSDIQFVIATLYYSDPESVNFINELCQDFNAVVLDDSRRFRNSARWLYRVRSAMNYIYTLTPMAN